MKPILLIPGLCGSRLQAKNKRTGSITDAFINNNMFNLSKIPESIATLLWGQTDDNLQFISWMQDYVNIYPVCGVEGCSKLCDTALLDLNVLKKRAVAQYFGPLVEYLNKELGYIAEKDLFAYSYDWRLDPNDITIQEQLLNTFKSIQKITSQKCIVIAHSLGGILLQLFQQRYSNWNDFFDTQISLGVPYDGGAGFGLISPITGYVLRMPVNFCLSRGVHPSSGTTMALEPNPHLDNSLIMCSYVKMYKHENKDSVQQELQLLRLEDVVLNESVYGDEVPDLAFVLLKYLKGNPEKLTVGVDYWLLRLARSCRKGSVVLPPNSRSVTPSEGQEIKTSSKRIDNLFEKDFGLGVPTLEEFTNENVHWVQCDLFAKCKQLNLDKYRTSDLSQFKEVNHDFSTELKFSDDEAVFQKAQERTVYDIRNFSYFPQKLRIKGKIENVDFQDGKLLVSKKQLQTEVTQKVPWRDPATDCDKQSLMDVFEAVAPVGTMDHVMFKTNFKMWQEYINIKKQSIEYPKAADSYSFYSIVGSGTATPASLFYAKPIQDFNELVYQEPIYINSVGDGTILLHSALNDRIPQQFVREKYILPNATHARLMIDERPLQIIKEVILKHQLKK